MGYKISWIAVKDCEPSQVREMLSLSLSGDREEFPESPITEVALPEGWYLLHFNEFDAPALADVSLEKISTLGDVVTNQVHEGVMVSTASCFIAGKLVWRVIHDAQISQDHLEATGNLPANFETIKSEKMTAQHEDDDEMVDYIFDVPVDLAMSIVDYRYDMGLPNEHESPFHVLRYSNSANGRPARKMSGLFNIFRKNKRGD